MNRKFRIAGWLAVSALLAAAVLAPASVFATDLHASHQGTSWNDPEFQSQDCGGLKLEPGQVAWHFVLTSPQGDSGHLTATFQHAGAITVANTDSPSAVLHFWIITGHDTLLDAETTDVDGRNLNLSHICACGDKASQSAPAETASAPVETETAPAETQPAETQPAETQPVETQPTETEPAWTAPAETQPAETEPVETATAPVETATAPVETATAPVETATAPAETATIPAESERPTESLVINPQCPNCPPDASPSGKVDAATGTPHEGVTPPATDSITHKTNPSNSGWQLVLVALASLIATALVLTPATRRNRR